MLIASTGICPKKNPCKNNGTCVESDPNYKCNCTSNFNGTYCEESKKNSNLKIN